MCSCISDVTIKAFLPSWTYVIICILRKYVAASYNNKKGI